MTLIALLTDFGLTDTYVSEMKAVLFSCRQEHVVDLTHAVQPGDIVNGQFLLQTSFHHFPVGTVFLSVVDPGVGTERHPVAVSYRNYWFVGPDNGLFSFACTGSVYRILPPDTFDQRLSDTFHGRDLFAPAAARIASGDRSVLSAPVELQEILPLRFQETAEPGQSVIYHIDHFGNLVTGIVNALAGQVAVTISGTAIDRHETTFGHGEDGLFLFPGSRGFLEIALRNSNAANRLHARINQPIEVYPI